MPLLQASGLPLVELLWRDAEQHPNLLPRMHIQGSISSRNGDRTSLLNPSVVTSAGKAVSWTVSEKPGLAWIPGASLPQPIAWPGCHLWCLGCWPEGMLENGIRTERG